MLHEVLLSLYGHKSPLLQQISKDQNAAEGQDVFLPLSPPERALLAELSHLSQLHIQLKEHSAKISAEHPSIICRAVSNTILSNHLRQLREKVVEVESAILSKESDYVGGYNIVPLSTIVGEFTPWTRRIEWLWELSKYLLPVERETAMQEPTPCSGAAAIDYLRRELHTGYEDLQKIVGELLASAEMVWLRQLSSWLLYGKIHAHGIRDFFIKETFQGTKSLSTSSDFLLDRELAPSFISKATMDSILFIGTSLNQIRQQTNQAKFSPAASDPILAMVQVNLEHLKPLKSPFSSYAISDAVSSIRLLVSQNALAQILPLPRILQILNVLHDFLLLGRGEFVVSLISNADQRMLARHAGNTSVQPIRKTGRLDDITVKEGEVSAVLKQTWNELAALQAEDDPADETMQLGRDLLRLVIRPMSGSKHVISPEFIDFPSLLFPTVTSLRVSLPASSPFGLFLSSVDIDFYANIHGYLASIRRADMHLSSLWKQTSLRRSHPSAPGPPMSSTPAGKRKLATQRQRDVVRTKSLRRHWASVSKALFVMSELGGYLQGEVIKNHWEHLQTWVGQQRRDGQPVASTTSSRPGTASATEETMIKGRNHSTSSARDDPGPPQDDPASLSQAHRLYLRSLVTALLLRHEGYMTALRKILGMIDHFVALFERLMSVQHGLDLQEDEGVMDTLANYASNEKEILSEMERSRTSLEQYINDLVKQIRDIDEQRDVDDFERLTLTDGVSDEWFGCTFVPWRGRTIERLTMKLGFLAGEGAESLMIGDDSDE